MKPLTKDRGSLSRSTPELRHASVPAGRLGITAGAAAHRAAVLSNRREFLWRFGGGLGGIALAHLLGRHDLLADTIAPKPRPEFNGGLHHLAKVKRIIQLFMNGGVSQMDTFDYKPELIKRHGQRFDPGTGEKVEAATSVPG